MTEHAPPDPRRGRFLPLSLAMQRALALVAVLAAVTMIAPDEWHRVSGWAMAGTLIAAPLVRLMWLIGRWSRRGDLRYAAVATGVLLIVATGTLLAVR